MKHLESLSFESKISLRWAVLDRMCPQDEYGKRRNPEKFQRGSLAFEQFIISSAVATVTDKEGELCFVVSIGPGLYLDEREWLNVVYIKPSHGFTPHDHYSGYWLPNGIKLNNNKA